MIPLLGRGIKEAGIIPQRCANLLTARQGNDQMILLARNVFNGDGVFINNQNTHTMHPRIKFCFHPYIEEYREAVGWKSLYSLPIPKAQAKFLPLLLPYKHGCEAFLFPPKSKRRTDIHYNRKLLA
jgi:hypothetical protein